MTDVERLYLIDGSSYIYRAFFALPPLSSPAGLPTNAVYGFTTMLLKLLSEAKPKYIGVVFDALGPTFRDEMYADYKANRPPTPEDLSSQVDLVHRIVDALRIHTLCIPGVEADDVIASLTAKFEPQGVECVIATGDKDLMQLVSPRVLLWDTMRDRWIDEAAVRERWGVDPTHVVDVMALIGDPIDNIPGVKGIGEKTAAALLQQFGDLDRLLSHLPEVEKSTLRGAKKIAERLREGTETARMSRELAKVRRDVPLQCELETFRHREADVEALRVLFSQLGFQSLTAQLTKAMPPMAVQVRPLVDATQIEDQLVRARRDGWLALVTLAEPGPAATTPASGLIACGSNELPVKISIGNGEVRRVVAEFLACSDIEWIGHDLKRDLLQLEAAGFRPGGKGVDVMIASYLVDAGAAHGLEELARDQLGVRIEGFRASEEATAAGVQVLPKLWRRLSTQLRDQELERLFYDVEMPLLHVLERMERRGILVDVGHLTRLSAELEGRMEGLAAEIYALAGAEFNINSPPQLREILFDRLNLSKKGVRRGKTGYSTDVDVLNRLAKDHALPAKILEYRALVKLKSTYADALRAAVSPVTGRLHTTFNQTVATTGRLSSSEPNLQNIPIRGEEGKRIREAFVAPAGRCLISADYSQIELRILAHLSGDPALLDAFTRGQDIHARTAAEIFGVLPGTVTDDMRRVAKVINFGIIYGMGAQRLSQELSVSVAEAQHYIESYFARYSGVRRYMQEVIARARETGFVSTILGRRRPLPELRSGDRRVAQAAERAATNAPIQGSAADLIKLAMVAVERSLECEHLDAVTILQVHDELLFEASETDRDATCDLVRREMEQVLPLRVPLRIDIGFGRSWAEAH
jgi:DNA polymerase-1